MCYLTAAVILVLCIAGYAEDIEPELDVPAPVKAPIQHQQYFRTERDLFGYAPRFQPNPVCFDLQDRPYIRTIGEGCVVQTLDEEGRWIELDFKPAIREKYPDWNGRIETGPFFDERVVFDDDGDAYTVAATGRSNIGRCLLLYSTDRCRTWTAHDLPDIPRARPRLEFRDGHNDLSRPPAVLNLSKRGLMQLILPEKTDEGLTLPEPVQIAEDSLQSSGHSGAGNTAVSSGDLVHLVYASSTPRGDTEAGTPQYAVTYNRSTGELTEPVFLGLGGTGAPDAHNLPSLSLDSKGYLHVVTGAHHDNFKYTRSLEPDSVTGGWTDLTEFGAERSKMGEGSYTYAALLCDQDDTLHVVGRWAGAGYFFRLAYLRKQPGRDWEDQELLVSAFRRGYSCWYHKLNLDGRGRLFLNYWQYSAHLRKDEARVYEDKWTDETLEFAGDTRPISRPTWEGMQRHDPCIIASADGGDSWHIAITHDFDTGPYDRAMKRARAALEKDDMQGRLEAAKAALIEKPGDRAALALKETASNAMHPFTRGEPNFINGLGIKLTLIEPGEFTMGSEQGDFDEKPAYRVEINKPFYMGTREVTVGQFRKFIEDTGYETTAEKTGLTYVWHEGMCWCAAPGKGWRDPDYEQTDDHPVVCVSDDDVQAFCEWLSEREGRHYRLPTEEEWEYACRAGTQTAYSFGDTNENVDEYAWHLGNSERRAHPVGQKKPNPWGLYDMHGNVWEWTKSLYTRYPGGTVLEPELAQQGDVRAIRGGSWADDMVSTGAHNLRSSTRYYVYFPNWSMGILGFRVVLDVPQYE